MSEERKVSVVVPIYNVEKYLSQCIDSIIAQSYTNIEIVLVDDGSPDNSGAVCDSYAIQDNRVKVFHIPNGGVAKARQYGVENSAGQYILFVDADDYMPVNAIELLITHMSCDTDIVIGAVTRFYDDKGIVIEDNIESCQYSGIEYLQNLLIGNIFTGPIAKLFQKELFQGDSFPAIKRGQDYLMNIDLGCRADSVVVISDTVYQYRAESDSSSLYGFVYTFEYCKNICTIIESILTRNCLFDKLNKQYCIASLNILFNAIKSGASFDYSDPLVDNIKSQLKGEKLLKSTNIVLLSLSSPLLRWVIRKLYTNIRAGRMIGLRKLIKKVLNK